MKFFIFLSHFGLLISCKTRHFDTQKNALPNAIVSKIQLENAFKIIKNTYEYLPFEFADDGCYARSYFMAMELASEGIPSSSLFVKSALNTPLPVNAAPFGKLAKLHFWNYHVAPVLVHDKQLYVIDPALFPEGPVLEDVWSKKVSSSIMPLSYLVKIGSNVTFKSDELRQGKNWVSQRQLKDSAWATKLSEMDLFTTENNSSFCGTIRSFLLQSKLSDEKDRRVKLSQRVRYLIPKLAQLKLVEPDWQNFGCTSSGSKVAGGKFIYAKEEEHTEGIVD